VTPPLASVPFEKLLDVASLRYRKSGITAWQFGRGKLRHDPLYRAVWERPELHRTGTLIDIGCGQGLILALFLAQQTLAPSSIEIPKLVGVETRPGIAQIARLAVSPPVEIISADIRHTPLPRSQTVLIFDVLHMMPAVDQESVLDAALTSLEVGGTLMLREADAAAGWRFRCVALANRLKALTRGYSSRDFHFRSKDEWLTVLERKGIQASAEPMSAGTPFGNVLFVGYKRPLAPGCSDRDEP
ncbi:MAG TPA: class I SAM-dependent methyltransferase, partial [Opitutaceae bacterium]|nr:class I SAM-dependent methyltransferase [Opitutaceae bacterium]